ncbi:MAG: hypothetical protein HND58_00805 [Planctomycetota bacterium]|nr:MAG: hypothetical protein HND58_00805 [Planctomycetota bacterium]
MWDPRRDLFEKFAARYAIDESLYFDDLDAMLDTARPEAASVMTSTADHLLAVEACAPRGVHAAGREAAGGLGRARRPHRGSRGRARRDGADQLRDELVRQRARGVRPA